MTKIFLYYVPNVRRNIGDCVYDNVGNTIKHRLGSKGYMVTDKGISALNIGYVKGKSKIRV